MFECEASGREDLPGKSQFLRLEAAQGLNGWTKKSHVELVEALHETDNDE